MIISQQEYDKGIAAAKARAEWEIGDSSWAQVIIDAFMYPDTDSENLAEEQGI